MIAFVTCLRHPDNAVDYPRVEELLADTLRPVTAQTSEDFVVIVVGSRRPSFELPARTCFVPVDFAPPAPANGPHATRDAFVRDKGTKIGVGLIAAKEFRPDYVMIFDADDFVHRDIAAWAADHPGRPGWYVDEGWMLSAARGALRPITELYRTCGTCYIVPFEAYGVPVDLTVAASQDELVAAYGERLTRIMGAHRDAVAWYAEHDRILEPLPFRGAVYLVDTGENHSGKVLNGISRPITRRMAREYGIVPRGTLAGRWWRSAGPRAAWETWGPKVRGVARRAPRPVRRVLSGLRRLTSPKRG